jgi:hypothetical protein
MANASGPASAGFRPANFTHAESGVSYRISQRSGHVYLDFSRDSQPGIGAPSGSDADPLRGRRELRYFVGSGRRGRTYLFEDDGYWFEIPVNWYGKKQIWDMAPNYLHAKEMPLTLLVDPGCLRCHVSGAQPSLPEARNKFAAEPFQSGGITCASCHGDASAHLASDGKAPMLRINDLKPANRDSICLSCHLEGKAAVVHQGKRLVDFKPGDSIFDYASYFVRQGETGSGGRATSQWEALLQSQCKRASGDKLTCTTCHDPHGSTSEMTSAESVSYYRGKCLSCHGAGGSAAGASKDFATHHHPERQDCAACHMPSAGTRDIAHEQVTDHRIQVRSGPSSAAAPSGPLVSVGAESIGVEASDRDLGLAYAQLAVTGDREAATKARHLLRGAERSAGPDHELHDQLGFLNQLAGDRDAASRAYSTALAEDPDDSFAAGNLALLKAEAHDYGPAMELWERSFLEDPVQLRSGMNLALVQCGVGRREAALATLDRMLHFSPDDHAAHQLEQGIRTGGHPCGRPSRR